MCIGYHRPHYRRSTSSPPYLIDNYIISRLLGDCCGDRWTISPSTSRISSQVCQYFIDEGVAEEKWNIVVYWAIWPEPSCQYLAWFIYHWYMRRSTAILSSISRRSTDSHDELLFCFYFMRFWDFGIRGPRNWNCSESIDKSLNHSHKSKKIPTQSSAKSCDLAATQSSGLQKIPVSFHYRPRILNLNAWSSWRPAATILYILLLDISCYHVTYLVLDDVRKQHNSSHSARKHYYLQY